MGGQSSEIERECQRKADGIREDLHRRVEVFRSQHQGQFDGISQQKKQLVKQSSAFELSQLMDKGQLTSQEITLTFIERTATIAIQNNYIIDELFQQALEKAKEIDALRQQNPGKQSWRYGDSKESTFPPFFGVPVSLKDNVLYPGRVSYLGHADPSNPIPQEESEFLILIKRMGLIPFVKTSSPQANKSFQTNNLILGYSKNPWDQTRSCNGSSGGQAGMLGSHCSPIGIGTDIANSMRGPADFNGLATLKPYYRYSNLGFAWSGNFSGGLFLRFQPGVMSRSVEDVIIWNQFMYDKQNYKDIPRKLKDPYLRLTPFRQTAFSSGKRYRIGYFTEFKGRIKCSPSHHRAVHQTLKMAEDLGHTTLEIDIKQGQELVLMLTRMWYGNPDLSLLNQIRKGEKPIPEYANAFRSAPVPVFIKQMLASLISSSEPRWSALIHNSKPFSVKDYVFMLADLNDLRKQVFEYLQEKNIDLIICPGFAIPAFKLGLSDQIGYCTMFTMIWNILNYPAGSLPVTVVQPNEQHFEDFHHDKIYRTCNESMKDSAGLPVGIQVVSYPGQEEEILHLMQQLEPKINFRQKHKSRAFSQ